MNRLVRRVSVMPASPLRDELQGELEALKVAMEEPGRLLVQSDGPAAPEVKVFCGPAKVSGVTQVLWVAEAGEVAKVRIEAFVDMDVVYDHRP